MRFNLTKIYSSLPSLLTLGWGQTLNKHEAKILYEGFNAFPSWTLQTLGLFIFILFSLALYLSPKPKVWAKAEH